MIFKNLDGLRLLKLWVEGIHSQMCLVPNKIGFYFRPISHPAVLMISLFRDKTIEYNLNSLKT